MTNIAKPRHRRGEGNDAYRARTADWDVTTDAATAVKAARSQLDAAIARLDYIEAAPARWGACHPIPAAQLDRVNGWRKALTDALAILDAVDADAWKPEIVAAMDGNGHE